MKVPIPQTNKRNLSFKIKTTKGKIWDLYVWYLIFRKMKRGVKLKKKESSGRVSWLTHLSILLFYYYFLRNLYFKTAWWIWKIRSMRLDRPGSVQASRLVGILIGTLNQMSFDLFMSHGRDVYNLLYQSVRLSLSYEILTRIHT